MLEYEIFLPQIWDNFGTLRTIYNVFLHYIKLQGMFVNQCVRPLFVCLSKAYIALLRGRSQVQILTGTPVLAGFFDDNFLPAVSVTGR